MRRRSKGEFLLALLLLIVTCVIALCFLLVPDSQVRHFPLDEQMKQGTAVVKTKTGIRRAYHGEKIIGYTVSSGELGEFIPVELLVASDH